jgi:hypothetical protein
MFFFTTTTTTTTKTNSHFCVWGDEKIILADGEMRNDDDFSRKWIQRFIKKNCCLK